MKCSTVPETQWAELRARLTATTGLHFTDHRQDDMLRCLASAAEEFGFEDIAACVDWLLSAPLTQAQLQVLASHFTIGETYFFRDMEMFRVLERNLLPEMISQRRGREQRLRLWSAACASGEEAYSLAIMLRQILPDFADWHVTILATDINPRVLRKAEAASYGKWSFRGVPADIKENYFNRSETGQYVVKPQIKEMVTFSYLNLSHRQEVCKWVSGGGPLRLMVHIIPLVS